MTGKKCFLSDCFGFLRKIFIVLKTGQISVISGPKVKTAQLFSKSPNRFFFSMLLADRHLRMIKSECF